MGDWKDSGIQFLDKHKGFRLPILILVWLAIIGVVVISCITVVRITSGKYFSFWQIEWNKTQPCTDTIKIHDTVRIRDIVKAPVVIKQQTAAPITTKDTKNQVIGNNYGSVGDNYFGSERVLTDADKLEINNILAKTKEKFGITTNYVKIALTPNSNGQKFSILLKEYLESIGYQVINQTTITNNVLDKRGVEYTKDVYRLSGQGNTPTQMIDCIRFTIGVLD